MKTIICIGGTSRSGSTLLDLIIANDERAMSLGEIKGIFHPRKKHAFEEIQRLKKNKVWKKILEDGKENLYPNLIKYFPDVDIFVDSSKNPFWFKYHAKNKKNEYIIKNVLIYKTPSELANSFIKRGARYEWVKFYEKYHRKYFSLIDDFVSISYKDLIINDKSLEQLCSVLGINYFKDKKNYWEKDQNTFFGSNSVKSKSSYNSNNTSSNQTRRNIKYDGVNKEYLEFINKVIAKYPHLGQIENQIRKRDIFYKNNYVDSKKFGYGKLYLFLAYVKMNLKLFYYYYYPKDIFKKT